MDFLTPAILNGVGVVGLFGGLFWFLATGRLVTRREADALEKRLVALEGSNKDLLAQNSELIELSRLGQSVFTALRQGAET